jgi:PAS domain S-box-containing protein
VRASPSKHRSAEDLLPKANFDVLEYCVDVIAWLGPDMRYIYVSPSCEKLFLRSAEELIGRNAFEFVLPEDIATVSPDKGAMETATVRVVRGDGSLIWVETNLRLINSANGGPGDWVVIMRDVSERKALEDELRAMAMKDGLTGLANRRAFDEVLITEWKRMRAGGGIEGARVRACWTRCRQRTSRPRPRSSHLPRRSSASRFSARSHLGKRRPLDPDRGRTSW